MAESIQTQALTNPSAQEVAKHYESARLNEMYKMADQFHKAGCFGKDTTNSFQVLVKMQAGYEMGMPPIEAMNSLYIVNGHITIWGMALTKRLRMRGWAIQYKDSPDECTVTISKGTEKYDYTATKAELIKMNSKAFQFAPKEKMRWHGLARLVRFSVPEVLDAGVSYLQEEAEDMRDLSGMPTIQTQPEETTEPEITYESRIESSTTEQELKDLATEVQKAQGAKQIRKGEAVALLGKILTKGKEIKPQEGFEIAPEGQTSINTQE